MTGSSFVTGGGLVAGAVAIDPAAFRGVLPRPFSASIVSFRCSGSHVTGRGP